MRRRLYLMRHGEVAYFPRGQPVANPETVTLTEEGRRQARAVRDALAGIELGRVVTSGLPRTLETARIVAPDVEPESWSELREIRGGRLDQFPEDELEAVLTGAFRGVRPEDARFIGGESIGELLDRVIPAIERLIADPAWQSALLVLHGGVNRAILSYALTGGRAFLGGLEQAPACVNVVDVGSADWVVRTVGWTPYDPTHTSFAATTMEELYQQFLRHRRGA